MANNINTSNLLSIKTRNSAIIIIVNGLFHFKKLKYMNYLQYHVAIHQKVNRVVQNRLKK